MAQTAFYQGQVLGPLDLNVFLTNAAGQRQDAAIISYALFQLVNNVEVLVGSPSRTPSHDEVGAYYASFVIPTNAPLGEYHIRWTFQQTMTSAPIQIVQEFTIVSNDTVITSASLYSEEKFTLINSVRINLRDNNPDRNYHFRPPTGEGPLTRQTRVFGFIWEDIELSEYLERGIDMVNLAAPLTGFITDTVPRPWWAVTIHGAMIHALRALAINWVEEEFDYSIGGISLSITKAEKYESLLNSLEDEFTNELIRAKETIKLLDGLQQPRFGIGIRSFPADALIKTKSGLIEVKDLIGKKFEVLSADIDKIRWKPGIVYIGEIKKMMQITIDGIQYRMSFDHPLMMENRIYVEAKDLTVGALIKKIELPGKVEEIKDLGEEQSYDVEAICPSLEDFGPKDGHNLAIGSFDRLVKNLIFTHNSSFGPYCLPADSEILTKQKYFQIKDLIGRKFQILSSDADGNHWKDGTTYLGSVKKLVEIMIDGSSYRTSFDHPFMLADRSYLMAEQLRPGMLVQKLELPGKVESIVERGKEQTYDIEVTCNSPEDFSKTDGHNLAMGCSKKTSQTLVFIHNSGRGILTPRKFVSF